MVEIADIFRLHGPDYRTRFGDRMLPSHLRAMREIEQCRTEALGGQLYFCEQCAELHYSFHSCKNRHCPKCQNDQAEAWLENQKSLLLPVNYFMLTFTLPEELRSLARSHQKTVYNILFRASADALLELAADPRFVGGKVGMVGVLHTWTRDLFYHPHTHYIATGGGLSDDGRWLDSRPDFLIHVKPLSILFRAKFRDQLKKTDLFPLVDQQTWNKDWVVHCQLETDSKTQTSNSVAPMSRKPILTIFSLNQGAHFYCGVRADLRSVPRTASSLTTIFVSGTTIGPGNDRLILIMTIDLRLVSFTICSRSPAD